MYPNDISIFDRESVSLELPESLVATAFSTATRAAKIIGDLIKNSSRRVSIYSGFFKLRFGDALIIKNTAPIMASTTMAASTSTEADNLIILKPETKAKENNTSIVESTVKDDLNDF